jgi:ribosome recycling factor
MQPLTDEERKKLCEALRRKARAGSWRVPMCEEAADEIERLAKKDTTSKDLIGALTYDNKRLAEEVKKLKDELNLVRQDEERFIYD